jgi:hypothetical protein
MTVIMMMMIMMISMTVMVMIIMMVTMIIIIMIVKQYCDDKQQKEAYLTPNLPAQNQYGSPGLEPVSLQSAIQNT